MYLFYCSYECCSVFPKQSLDYKRTFLVNTVNQEDQICQLSLGKKVNYVSLEVLTDLENAFELTGLQPWHQRKRIKIQILSQKQSKTSRLNFHFRLLHLLPMPKMTVLQLFVRHLLSSWAKHLLVSEMSFGKLWGKIMILKYRSWTHLITTKAFLARRATVEKTDVDTAVWQKEIQFPQWSSIRAVLQRYLCGSSSLDKIHNVIGITSQKSVKQRLQPSNNVKIGQEAVSAVGRIVIKSVKSSVSWKCIEISRWNGICSSVPPALYWQITCISKCQISCLSPVACHVA